MAPQRVTNIRVVEGVPPPQPSTDPHAYFQMLAARPETVRAATLRDNVQLKGWAQAPNGQLWVTYDAAADAARVVVPAFSPIFWASLAAPVSATDTVLTLAKWHSAFISGRAALIDSEAMYISAVDATNLRVMVKRGQLGTVAAPHALGAQIRLNNNSLLNQLRVPFASSLNHRYLVTWDVKFDPSMVKAGTGFKAFQLSQAPTDTPYLETQMQGDGKFATGKYEKNPDGTYKGFNAQTDVAALTWRTYAGINADPLLPMAAGFVFKPQVWTRIWIEAALTATSNERVNAWAADANRDPVQLQLEGVFSGPAMLRWWIEMNTSNDRLAISDMRDRVAFVRNLVVLQDVAEVAPLLVRPVA